MKRKLKVKFVGFLDWPMDCMHELAFISESSPEKNYFFKCLAETYDLEISEAPDILFVCCFSRFAWNLSSLKFDCLKICITLENIIPNWGTYDYAFSYGETDDRNFQLPCFAAKFSFDEFRTQRYSDKVMEWRNHPKLKFCNFVGRREEIPGHHVRVNFVKQLMSYKKVDCPGLSQNNIKAWEYRGGLDSKYNFIKSYKFTVAFENEIASDYVTEKIYDALLVGSIPIYRGSPRIHEYFNPESFINCDDYDNFDQVIQRVIEVDNDESLYRKYTEAPPLLKNSKLHSITPEAVRGRLDAIVDSLGVKTPVTQKLFHKTLVWIYYRALPTMIKRRIKKYLT